MQSYTAEWCHLVPGCGVLVIVCEVPYIPK